MKILVILCLSLLTSLSYAEIEHHDFQSLEQEQSYQTLISELRCLVCQNQTIADSNADLAKDLRRQVYEMLQQGHSQQQIADFMTERYGDFVLYNPNFNLKTGLLWLGPALFLLIGLIAVLLFARKKTNSESGLTDEQKSQLAKILDEGEKP
jgi:cytochrome c-type biogenesis protein CcmH